MNLKVSELKLILCWFDLAEINLEDSDLKLYDRIKEYLEDKDMESEDKEDDDDLTYHPPKKKESDDWDNYNDDDDSFG